MQYYLFFYYQIGVAPPDFDQVDNGFKTVVAVQPKVSFLLIL